VLSPPLLDECVGQQHRFEPLAGIAGLVPGLGDPSVIREFMRQIGIPARVGT